MLSETSLSAITDMVIAHCNTTLFSVAWRLCLLTFIFYAFHIWVKLCWPHWCYFFWFCLDLPWFKWASSSSFFFFNERFKWDFASLIRWTSHSLWALCLANSSISHYNSKWHWFLKWISMVMKKNVSVCEILHFFFLRN